MKKLYATALLMVTCITLQAGQPDLHKKWMDEGLKIQQQHPVKELPAGDKDQLGGRFTKFSYDILKKVWYA